MFTMKDATSKFLITELHVFVNLDEVGTIRNTIPIDNDKKGFVQHIKY